VKLAEHNRLKLLWVPGHMGIDRNEITDQSAKDGSSLPLIGPGLARGMSASVARGGDQGLDEQKTQGALAVHVWTQAGYGLSFSFLFFFYFIFLFFTSAKGAGELFSLRRNQLRIMTVLLKEHCHLKGH